MYTGNPETNTGWTEASDSNGPGDRRIFMSCGPYNLNIGETFCVDIAFPFARGTVDAHPALAVGELRQNADLIQEFYDSFDYQCLNTIVNIKENTSMEVGLSIYPNPSTGMFFFNSDKEINYIEVYDLPGKLVFTSNRLSQNTKLANVDLTGRVNGVYLFKAHHRDGSVYQGKIVVE